MNRLKNHFDHVIQKDLLFKDHFINEMQIPKINKIVLNSGVGNRSVIDKKDILNVLLGLELITNQKAQLTRAKKSIDKFKLRKNMPVGCKLTLRKKNIYVFLEKLIHNVLPNNEDFKDISDKIKRLEKKDVGIFIRTTQENEEKNAGGEKMRNFRFTPNALNTEDKLKIKALQVFKEKEKKSGIFTTGFGINDFFLFKEIPYDKLDALSGCGFDIRINFKETKRGSTQKHISSPNYVLSGFQMPL